MLGFGQGSGVGETDLERVLRELEKESWERECMHASESKEEFISAS